MDMNHDPAALAALHAPEAEERAPLAPEWEQLRARIAAAFEARRALEELVRAEEGDSRRGSFDQSAARLLRSAVKWSTPVNRDLSACRNSDEAMIAIDAETGFDVQG